MERKFHHKIVFQVCFSNFNLLWIPILQEWCLWGIIVRHFLLIWQKIGIYEQFLFLIGWNNKNLLLLNCQSKWFVRTATKIPYFVLDLTKSMATMENSIEKSPSLKIEVQINGYLSTNNGCELLYQDSCFCHNRAKT
jgi:hypothetical protein